jgi:hypothetical protein
MIALKAPKEQKGSMDDYTELTGIGKPPTIKL